MYQTSAERTLVPWEIVTAKNGYSYKQWRQPLPRIPDIILNSIVYLYRDEEEAETGAEVGGSGFLLVTPSRARLVSPNARRATHIYVVTNAHVIESGSSVVRVNLKHKSSGFKRTQSFPFQARRLGDPPPARFSCLRHAP